MAQQSLAKLTNAVQAAKTSEPSRKTLRDVIMDRAGDIARALPAETGMTPDRLTMVSYTLIRMTPKLAGCTPDSMIGALMTAAQLGLEPGPLQHCYFIPRWNSRTKCNEVTFQVGYKGMIELARRNGVQIKTRTVYEGDHFEIVYGFEDEIIHRPTLGERGAVLGYYLVATWDGGKYATWMNKADIERIRLRSESGDKGPWLTDYDAMARKTVVRYAFNSNQIPQSVAIARAINADEQVRTTIDADVLDIVQEPRPDDALALDPADDEPADAEIVADPETGEIVDEPAGVADPPESMPDDIEAALMWLRSLTPKELKEQARRYKAAVPRNAGDMEPMTELAERILAGRKP